MTAVRGERDELAVVLGDEPSPGAPAMTWARVPGGAGARLVPLSPRRAAAAAVAPRGGSRADAGVARRLLGVALRAGVAQPALRQRVRVAREGSLLAALERALGIAPLSAGIDTGPRRANRKPVLQVLDARGETVAWAKVGWDGVTSALVRHEGDVLERLAQLGLSRIAAPEVLARLRHGDAHVLVTRPLPMATRGAPLVPPPADAVRDVARLSPEMRGPMLASEWWAGARADLDVAVVDAVTVALDAVTATTCGFHGDLSPWNCWWAGDRLCVVDWERAGGPVPLGADALHGAFLVACLRERRSVRAALDAAVVAGRPVLAELGIGSDDEARAVAIAYLVELLVRVQREERVGSAGPLAAVDLRDALLSIAGEAR